MSDEQKAPLSYMFNQARRMDEAVEARIAQQPKWVQEYIKNLKMRLQEAIATIDRTRVRATSESRLIVDPHSDYPMQLPEDTLLRWVMPNGDQYDVRLASSWKGDIHGLQVMATGSLSSEMTVRPRSSNVVVIQSERL